MNAIGENCGNCTTVLKQCRFFCSEAKRQHSSRHCQIVVILFKWSSFQLFQCKWYGMGIVVLLTYQQKHDHPAELFLSQLSRGLPWRMKSESGFHYNTSLQNSNSLALETVLLSLFFGTWRPTLHGVALM